MMVPGPYHDAEANRDFEMGRPKYVLTEAAIAKIADAFHASVDVELFMKVVTVSKVAVNDYSLSPSRHVIAGIDVEHREIGIMLQELLRANRDSTRVDGELASVFASPGSSWEPEK